MAFDELKTASANILVCRIDGQVDWLVAKALSFVVNHDNRTRVGWAVATATITLEIVIGHVDITSVV